MTVHVFVMLFLYILTKFLSFAFITWSLPNNASIQWDNKMCLPFFACDFSYEMHKKPLMSWWNERTKKNHQKHVNNNYDKWIYSLAVHKYEYIIFMMFRTLKRSSIILNFIWQHRVLYVYAFFILHFYSSSFSHQKNRFNINASMW